MAVDKSLGFLYKTNLTISERLGFLYSNTDIDARMGFKYASTLDFSKRLGFNYSVISDTFYQAIHSTYQTVGHQILLRSAGVDTNITPYAESITIEKNMNTPVRWDLNFADLPTGWKNLLSPLSSKNKRLIAQFKTGGESWYMPDGTLLRMSFKARPDSYPLTCSGTDLSRFLLLKNQTYQSYISTPTVTQWARAIVADLLTACGITNYRLEFDDFPVRILPIQGKRPLDVINEVLEVAIAYWYFDRDCFVAKPLRTSGQPNWTYTDNENVYQLDYDEDLIDIENQIELSLAARNYAKVNQGGDQEYNTYGRQHVTLTDPTYNIMPVVLSSNFCDVYDVDLFDVDGNWTNRYWPKLGAQQQPTQTNKPTKEIYFTIYQNAEALALFPLTPEPFLKIKFVGFKNELAQNQDFGSYFQNEFAVKISHNSSILNDGLMPSDYPIENILIPNQDHARRLGEFILWQKQRESKKVSFQCPFNPWMNVGDIVRVRERVKSNFDELILIMGLSLFSSAEESYNQFSGVII